MNKNESLLTLHLCFLFLKKSDKMLSKSSVPFCLSLNITPSCHTLWKALDISRKTLLTSNPLSKDE